MIHFFKHKIEMTLKVSQGDRERLNSSATYHLLVVTYTNCVSISHSFRDIDKCTCLANVTICGLEQSIDSE